MQKGQSPHTVGVQYAVGAQCAVCTQYTVGVSAKGQLTQWILQIWVVGTIAFSAKRSNPHSGVCSRHVVRSMYAVCIRC